MKYIQDKALFLEKKGYSTKLYQAIRKNNKPVPERWIPGHKTQRRRIVPSKPEETVVDFLDSFCGGSLRVQGMFVQYGKEARTSKLLTPGKPV